MVKNVTNIFDKFIFMIALIIFILLLILTVTLCNKKYIVRKMDKNNYFSKLTIDIREEVQNYTIQSGFSKDLFDQVFDEETVRKDLVYIISRYYDNKKIELDNTGLKEKMNNKINYYLQEKNAKAQEEDLEKFTDMISDVYKTKLTIGSNLKYLGKLNIISKISIILLPLLFTGMLVTVLIKIFKDELEFFISPIIASSLIFIFIDIYINNKIDIKNILLFGTNFSIVLRDVIYSILNCFKVIGLLGLVMSLLILIIISIKRKKTCFFKQKMV